MKFRLCLDYSCYPVWEVEECAGSSPIPTGDLYFSDTLKEKINRLDDLYHSLFINNAIEFSYIGAQKPEIEQEVKRLIQEIVQGIRAELKDGDELVRVSSFLTAAEMETEKASSEKKKKRTVNNNAYFESLSLSENFDYLPDKLEYGTDFSLEHDIFHFYLIQGAYFDGNYDFPIVIDKEIKIPKYLIPFSKRMKIKDEVKKDVALHFYMHDVEFTDFLEHPENYLKEIKEFGGIVSPDPSLYTNMPLAVQLYHSFLNRAITFFCKKTK